MSTSINSVAQRVYPFLSSLAEEYFPPTPLLLVPSSNQKLNTKPFLVLVKEMEGNKEWPTEKEEGC